MFTTIEVNNKDESFDWIIQWFSSQQYSLQATQLTLSKSIEVYKEIVLEIVCIPTMDLTAISKNPSTDGFFEMAVRSIVGTRLQQRSPSLHLHAQLTYFSYYL
jgi:hypothetical protein